MRTNLILVLCTVSIIACDPNGSNPPCSLDYLNNSTYLGNVNYCSAMPDNQLEFSAKAFLTVRDDVIVFNIFSIDTSLIWSHIDSSYFECWYAEGNEKYKLYSFESNLKIGDISRHGYTIFYRFQKDTCLSSYFSGELE